MENTKLVFGTDKLKHIQEETFAISNTRQLKL